VLTNTEAFFLFAWDKVRSGGQDGNRISKFNLAAVGAVGGWPGGLLAMLVFRHKTAKLSFKLKYALTRFPPLFVPFGVASRINLSQTVAEGGYEDW
jgi:uncharacterized membrane protein YsdA (DUF1294 family)